MEIPLHHECSSEQIKSCYKFHSNNTNFINEFIFPADLEKVYKFLMKEEVFGFGVRTTPIKQSENRQIFAIKPNLLHHLTNSKKQDLYCKCGFMDEKKEEAIIVVHRADSSDLKTDHAHCILLKSQQGLTLVVQRFKMTKSNTFDKLEKFTKKDNEEKLRAFKSHSMMPHENKKTNKYF